jgi:DNA modification methylase
MSNQKGNFVGQIKPNAVVHGDCLEMMKLIPDHSVDMILADLPYG